MLKKIMSYFAGEKTLYFPGCTTIAKMPQVAQNYESLFRAAGIPVMTLSGTVCCGGFCLDGGYRDDFENLREKNMELFQAHHVTKIITNDPHCYRVFQEHYAIPVEYAAVALKDFTPSDKKSETVSYHDPCLLARHTIPITSEPRSLLEKKGLALQELPCSRDKTKCCGAGGLLPLHNSGMAKRIGGQLLKSCHTSKLVTCCPLCYVHLRMIGGREVVELSEVL